MGIFGRGGRVAVIMAGAGLLIAGYLWLDRAGIAIPPVPETESGPVGLAALVAVALAGLALVVSGLAVAQVGRMRRELRRLMRSSQAHLGHIAAQHERATATIAALNGQNAGAAQGSRDAGPPDDGPAAAAEDKPAPIDAAAYAANVIPHPASLPRTERDHLGPAIEEQLAAAVRAGTLELGLEPIISVSTGVAAAFNVFAHVRSGDDPADIWRLAAPVSGVGIAEFERVLLATAAETARRQFADGGRDTPLHVPVSRALCDDCGAFDLVASLFEAHPALAKTLIPVLPAAILDGAERVPALKRLADAGVTIAVEGWSARLAEPDTPARFGIGRAMIAGDRLLGRVGPTRGEQSAAELLEAARSAGIDLVATDVANDGDAVNIAELGIDLMCGARFSGPRRLKGGSREAAALG